MKKRLKQYKAYRAPVSSVSWSCDGGKLAVGVGYTWDEGEEGAKGAERPGIFIKEVGEEVKVCVLPVIPSSKLTLVLSSRKERWVDISVGICNSDYRMTFGCCCILVDVMRGRS